MGHQPQGPGRLMGFLVATAVVLALILLAAWVVESEAIGATAREQRLERALKAMTVQRNLWRREARALRVQLDRCVTEGPQNYTPVPIRRKGR